MEASLTVPIGCSANNNVSVLPRVVKTEVSFTGKIENKFTGANN